MLVLQVVLSLVCASVAGLLAAAGELGLLTGMKIGRFEAGNWAYFVLELLGAVFYAAAAAINSSGRVEQVLSPAVPATIFLVVNGIAVVAYLYFTEATTSTAKIYLCAAAVAFSVGIVFVSLYQNSVGTAS